MFSSIITLLKINFQEKDERDKNDKHLFIDFVACK